MVVIEIEIEIECGFGWSQMRTWKEGGVMYHASALVGST